MSRRSRDEGSCPGQLLQDQMTLCGAADKLDAMADFRGPDEPSPAPRTYHIEGREFSARPLAPGLYLVRLQQGTNVRVARAAVLQ